MSHSKTFLILIFWSLTTWSPLFSQRSVSGNNYLTAIAKAGDDALDLLDRYELAEYDCNVSQFLKINQLETHKLKAGATYKLPVMVVAYNGKSIRTTLDIEDWRTAKRIETYNKTAQKKGLRPDYFIDNKKLWVPWHELNCQETEPAAEPKKMAAGVGLAAKSEVETPRYVYPIANRVYGGEKDYDNDRNFELYGPNYAYTPLLNRNLKGHVFYLISGHGGPDVGAQGKRAGNNLCEDEYAYDVTLRLHRLLISHGATAYMIVRDNNDGIRDDIYLDCDKDEVVLGEQDIPTDQRERLQQRTDLINALTEKHLKVGQTNQTIIEIHVDSRSLEKKQDIFFYFRPESAPSQRLAEHIQRTFAAKYKKAQGGRGYAGSVTSRTLFTLKETTARKAVYIELANIQNDWDQQRLVLRNNRQAIANWICHALLTQ
ncbi:MAG: N-acetylmuramoyl-L-alanine amidase [Chitinophagales bacterium]|nr:N-acetylmuramoyl-L-alanine amidase [Chitinophagales bacterium]